MMAAYYNEIDPDAVHVLRHLSDEGMIAPGVVDSRSIKEITPDDLKGFTQCHFFAGAGLWSVAARLAGWPDERPLWTGSCPCQPFSAAGKGLGTDDPRHLWPDFFRLIRACRPPVVMGEQVAGAPGYGWFDGVAADLESEDYASRSIDIPACAVDAPQIRQRQWWVGVDDRHAEGRLQSEGSIPASWRWDRDADDWRGDAVSLEHGSSIGRREGRPEHELRSGRPAVAGANVYDVATPHGSGLALGSLTADEPGTVRVERETALAHDDRGVWRGAGRNGSAWASSEWILCHDGKARRTEPGLRLLVNGMAGRIPAWRLGGNSISPILAAEVIAAFMEAYP